MKRTKALWIILDLIFLVIFNAIYFVAGGVDYKISAWISYGFIHFAYLMLLLAPALTRNGKSAAVFGFSLYSVSSVYFFAEFVLGVVFILISPDSYKAALLIQLIVAGLYGIALISNMLANEHTAAAEEKRQYEIDYVKKASAELKGMINTVSDKEAMKKLEKVYDALHSSPVKSHPDLAQTEAQILMSIGSLKTAVASGDAAEIITLAETLFIEVGERNRQLKLLN
jgi:hypothetical protein